MRPVKLELSNALAVLQTGDILLAHADSVQDRIIGDATGSVYDHASMVVRVFLDNCRMSRWMIAETVQGPGCRLIDFKREITAWSGYYDLYRLNVAFDAEAAARFMLEAPGAPYGWPWLSRSFFRRELGQWVPPIKNSADPIFPRDCSGLVSAALRQSNGLILDENDCDVSPGDIAKSSLLSYVATLYRDF